MVAPHLRDDYHIIAPDQRGHGQTTQAGGGYDWGTLTEDVVGLMDELALPKAAVFGQSWGATVALNVAARAPEPSPPHVRQRRVPALVPWPPWSR